MFCLVGDVAEDEYPIARDAATTIGRKECDITFENDTLMSDRHASITHTTKMDTSCATTAVPTACFCAFKQARKTPVGSGDLVRAGRQFLLFSSEQRQLPRYALR